MRVALARYVSSAYSHIMICFVTVLHALCPPLQAVIAYIKSLQRRVVELDEELQASRADAAADLQQREAADAAMWEGMQQLEHDQERDLRALRVRGEQRDTPKFPHATRLAVHCAPSTFMFANASRINSRRQRQHYTTTLLSWNESAPLPRWVVTGLVTVYPSTE